MSRSTNTSILSKMQAKLTSRRKVAANAFEAIFSLGKKLDFEPGQYLTITVPNLKNDPKGNGRIFSIVNTPKENKFLKILFRATGSPFKRHLLKMPLGETVKISDPIGEFNPQLTKLTQLTSPTLVFLAAGIGISPFMSMLPVKATWFFSNHSKSSAPYLEKLPKDAHLIFTNKNRRLDLNQIRSNLPNSSNLSNYVYFIAGAPEFVEDLEDQLINAGVKPKNINRESFDGE